MSDNTVMKTIGILTSGGDAPGMNAAVRAVARYCLNKGHRVIGIKRGYAGLLEEDMEEMSLRSVSEIIHRGGTILQTARCDEYNSPEGVEKAHDICVKHGIDSLVALGGDGTFRGALDLSRTGINCVGIPCTIDNDIACSDYSIGFDTAQNTAMDMIDKLRDTSRSHNRVSVVEVMGHKAGWLALETGLACGALSILVPECKWDFNKDIVERMLATMKTGKKHFIIVMAEGCGSSYELAQKIEDATGITTRATVLGHVQRGGSPTTRDRVMASTMGIHAAQLALSDDGDKVVCFRNGKVTALDFEKALAMKKSFDRRLLELAKDISI